MLTDNEKTADIKDMVKTLVKGEAACTLDSIKRLDDRGVLYEMDYTADYYDSAIVEVVKGMAEAVRTGCSAFSTYNTAGEYLLCRNYDYLHKDSEGNVTGLSVIVHTAPAGKLKSIGVCDAFWLNDSAYYAGALDDGVTDRTAMLAAPYMCVDGMNEAGLAASLLLVDLKAGESHINQNTGKERAFQSMLLRFIIDNAHNVEEAVRIAEKYDVYSTGDSDIHVYINDRDGNSAVLEWRQYEGDAEQKLYVTYTNAVTNFFVGFEDGQDAYREDGTFRELYAKLTATFNGYKYGYGHGYHRFNQIVSTLERYIESDANEHGIRNSVMDESQAVDLLKTISQDPGTERTSFTQFTAVYNLEKLTASFRMQRDFDNVYTFQ